MISNLHNLTMSNDVSGLRSRSCISEWEREGSKRALSPKLSKKQSINRLTYSPGIKIRRKSFLRVFIQRHQDCSHAGRVTWWSIQLKMDNLMWVNCPHFVLSNVVKLVEYCGYRLGKYYLWHNSLKCLTFLFSNFQVRFAAVLKFVWLVVMQRN